MPKESVPNVCLHLRFFWDGDQKTVPWFWVMACVRIEQLLEVDLAVLQILPLKHFKPTQEVLVESDDEEGEDMTVSYSMFVLNIVEGVLVRILSFSLSLMTCLR